MIIPEIIGGSMAYLTAGSMVIGWHNSKLEKDSPQRIHKEPIGEYLLALLLFPCYLGYESVRAGVHTLSNISEMTESVLLKQKSSEPMLASGVDNSTPLETKSKPGSNLMVRN